MMPWWSHSSPWAWLALSFGIIAFLALLAWAVEDIRRTDRRSADRARCNGASTAEAERIVAHLFARGELDSCDSHRRLADLEQQHHVGAHR